MNDDQILVFIFTPQKIPFYTFGKNLTPRLGIAVLDSDSLSVARVKKENTCMNNIKGFLTEITLSKLFQLKIERKIRFD